MFANQLFDKYSLENKDDFSDFLEDVTELTVQNYVENTHMFLYQEERKRQEILSRYIWFVIISYFLSFTALDPTFFSEQDL